MKKKRPAVKARSKSSGKAKASRAAPRTAAQLVPRIVGIGASAGGLDALRQFLANMPIDSALGFVVVQHQDPGRKSLLPELLQQATSMRVQLVSDRLAMKPNCVYIAPPNKDVCLGGTRLRLVDRHKPRGLGLPIDFFFRSLAQQQKERAIGIVLSGMGSDGMLGLAAIKERFGLTLVQQPETAQFDAMPRAAIDAGLADVLAPAAALPAKLLAILSHRPVPDRSDRIHTGARQQLESIVLQLRHRTGHDFSRYKESTLMRRIERRMSIHQITAIDAYAHHLHNNVQECDLLFRELLIGVTQFFRDAEAWRALEEKALPQLLEHFPGGKAMRAWVAGCSTGEEAYSLAIVFRDVIERLPNAHQYSLHIFATDLQLDAINSARQGVFPASIAAHLSADRLGRYFTEENGSYRIHRKMREMVTFASHNLVTDPPFTRLDVLSCRNVLIYLEADLQKRLFDLFQYSLERDGILFLGNAESIGSHTDVFAALDSSAHLYRRLPGPARAGNLAFAMPFTAPHGLDGLVPVQPSATNLQLLADQMMLQQLAPPAVLVNGQGDIVYVSGRTGKYLEPAAGRANWNIHVMARRGLRSALTAALSRALRTNQEVLAKNVSLGDHGPHCVDLIVHPIQEPEELRGLAMIAFRDTGSSAQSKSEKPGPRSSRVAELEQALERAREEIQHNREEMQASHEQLQSANEELQSTNEELMTSKEEMQSMNEELQTLNGELQARLEELSLASDDMKNLLNSTNIATVFLNSKLHVRRFTTPAGRLFKLLPGDVGRPLSDIATDLLYPELQHDAQEALRTLMFSEQEVTTADHRWYMVRIMPYLTTANAIDGVVITFTEITAAKHLEERLRESIKGR